MASKVNRQAMEEEKEFEIPTSMIDVVFLLLIFFMCATRFRTLEQRLEANLPKNEGARPTPTEVVVPQEIRIKISVDDSGRPVILAHDYPCADLNDLARKLKRLARIMPGLPVVIDGRQRVPFQYILGAVDACMRAELRDVKFQAPPVAGGGGSDYWYR